MEQKYTFVHISPQSPDLPSLAQKYKQLRLSALTQSPTAFSSTLAAESPFSDSVWIERLSADPCRHNFVAQHQASTGKDGGWVAQITVLGPVSAEAYTLSDEAGQPAVRTDQVEEKWQLLSLYTLPEHRGKGVGKDLCKEVFKWLKQRGAGEEGAAKVVRVRLMIKPDNTGAVRLYEGLGFEHAGMCTLAEALKANGDGDALPADGGGERYQRRSGYIMTLHFER